MIRRLAKLGFPSGCLLILLSVRRRSQSLGRFRASSSPPMQAVKAPSYLQRRSLEGAHVETQSNRVGKFVFNTIPAGSYTITAHAPGMAARQSVLVTRGTAPQVELEMKLQAVAESTTVTASAEPAETKEPSGTNTVGDSAVRNMPNIDEQFQSLLPLIPGVVRGPNDLINMKGARTSQNGSLVNSADVTDPRRAQPQSTSPLTSCRPFTCFRPLTTPSTANSRARFPTWRRGPEPETNCR
jgi:hypothetical protein